MTASALSQHWRAAIELGFSKRGKQTAMVHRKHLGPLRVQSPFYPEGNVCHVYLLHPPGGVVGGDHLEIKVNVNTDAHALMTTPASGKFYRSNGVVATQQQHLTVAEGAVLEWLPQDTILFSHSHVNMQTRVDLMKDAAFIGWDMLCLGRPASDEVYAGGYCRQTFELWRDGEPLLIERARYDSNSDLLQSAWGMQGKTVVATLLATHADQEVLKAARAVELCSTKGILSCSLINDVLVCRLLAHQGEVARHTFSDVWAAIRPLLLSREASIPRIWHT